MDTDELIDDEPTFDTAGVELPPLRTPVSLGDPADDEAPGSADEGLPQDAASPLDRYGAPPAHVREAWDRLTLELGHPPSTRAMQKEVGGNNQTRTAWCRMLAAEAQQALPEADAVAACRAALAAKTQQYGAWVETCQEAQAEVESCLGRWRDLEHARLTSDDVSLDDVKAAIEAHRQADVRATQVLPPLGPVLEAAEIAAVGALQTAIVEDQRQRRNRLGEQRRALILGPLDVARDAFLDQLHDVLDNIAAQQELDLELGLPPGNALEQLSYWLYTALTDVVPYPPRDRYYYNNFPRVEQLADVDQTLQPISPEDLPQAQGTALFWVVCRGEERPTFSIAGLERLQQNILNERGFQQGKAVEVTASEEAALRARYGEAISRVVPPVWR